MDEHSMNEFHGIGICDIYELIDYFKSKLQHLLNTILWLGVKINNPKHV
jgi:hypothetical protein